MNRWALCLVLLLSAHQGLGADNTPPRDHPGARWGHAFIYDAFRDEILLFGGASERGSYLGDTWVWDGTAWKEMEVSGPSARGFSAVTFHEDRKTIVLHGGRGGDGVTHSDTWEWNGENWAQLEENGPYSADHHQMAYLPATNRILAFGGWNGEGVSGDTWFWSGSWKRSEQASPPKRASFGMAYDRSEDKIKLFGGLWINGQYADLWEWNEGGWRAVGGTYDRSSLDHHAMIYDEELQKVILFGGKNYRYVMQHNTMAIDGGEFQVLSDEGPPARHSAGLAYDGTRHLGLLYGGKVYEGDQQIPLADLWQWDGASWHQIE
jgi:hypothetical protein